MVPKISKSNLELRILYWKINVFALITSLKENTGTINHKQKRNNLPVIGDDDMGSLLEPGALQSFKRRTNRPPTPLLVTAETI